MPMPGDQHRPTPVVANPFDEQKQHVGEYTAQEIATLQSRLDKQLGPEYISSRPGAAGQKVHYLAAEKCINLANEVFGFNGWSSAIQNIQIDFVDESASTGKISLGLSVIVRVTLKDGTYHEDIGYGHIENCKGKAAAFEKAKKEGTTDALKRALRNFGNVLGNCIYDKDYLSKITKVKIAPSKWDVDNLHRHPDYAPIKKESSGDEAPLRRPISAAVAEYEFDAADELELLDFSESCGDNHGNPDEIVLDNTPSGPPNNRINVTRPESIQNSGVSYIKPGNGRPLSSKTQLPSGPQTSSTRGKPQSITPSLPSVPNRNPPPSVGNRAASVPPPQKRFVGNPTTVSKSIQPQNPSQLNNAAAQPPTSKPTPTIPPPLPQQQPQPQSPVQTKPSFSNQSNPAETPPQATRPPQDLPVGFFTARAAESLQNTSGSLPHDASAFNPHSESPSIRKTSGFDHSKTKPITRESIGVSNPPSSTAMAIPRANFINPQTDTNRRIGMPGASASPLQNRSSYKPPGPAPIKRPLELNPAQSRQALGDVTAGHINAPFDTGGGVSGTDLKRPRLAEG
ncbi:hypothetical protein L228DRAFT_244581 [Xylona heveae TC161]|uniref:RAD52 homolog n=1 Tax=Xylona heveae (strain CBS 132557 / TC161) TaxID=1328760 RepID=A0A165J3W6_XYLHT|nr:hypothetical protein L228DRAFT_244581 [Xylona heveae TC161]KZF25694.1 hypothetical protein L228DRAFT_244581 [Xylona heveae TC161]